MGFVAAALPLITLATGAIGAGVSAYSAIAQGQAAKAAGDAANANAKTEARNAELEAAEQSTRERIKARRMLSTIRARMAGTGLVTDTGAPLAILGENAGNIELSFQDAARRTAMQAASIRQRGEMAAWEGKQQATSATIGAIGGLFGNAASLGGKYSDFVKLGALPDAAGIYKTQSRY
jgi:hypothetical protein